MSQAQRSRLFLPYGCFFPFCCFLFAVLAVLWGLGSSSRESGFLLPGHRQVPPHPPPPPAVGGTAGHLSADLCWSPCTYSCLCRSCPPWLMVSPTAVSSAQVPQPPAPLGHLKPDQMPSPQRKQGLSICFISLNFPTKYTTPVSIRGLR